MIKPERMSRIAIVGPRAKLDKAVRSLYELHLFHVVDYVAEDPEVKIGSPSPQSSEISQRLLRLRSIIRALHLEDYRPESKVPVDEIVRTTDQAIVTLDLEVNKKIEHRQSLTSRIRELTSQNETLDILRSIGLQLELYSAYDSLSHFIGTTQSQVKDSLLSKSLATETIEIPHGSGFAVAIFTRKSDSAAVQEILNSSGFQEIKPPFDSGQPADRMNTNAAEIEKLEKSLADEEKAIDTLREKFAPLVLASEEHYSIEIQQAETPLRVATTKNSFLIDGWVPVSSINVINDAMKSRVGDDVTVESLPVSKHEVDEMAPVKLNNLRVAKPFELFIELMSTPLYREIDPTLFVFVVFPLFFGLMIGDLGYGACLMLAGIVMWKKLGKDSEGWRRLGLIVLLGGFFSSLFGMFLYCDAFGLPFHPVLDENHELVLGGLSWETSIGLNIPLQPVMEKLIDVKDLLAISVLAAWIHMTIGLLVGFRNELSHGKKEAATKLVWVVILFGLFAQILFMAKGSPLRNTLFWTFCSPFAGQVIPVSGSMTLSIVAIGLIIVGVACFFALNGKKAMMELMEILSLLANVISYTRIAAIGVAKGAMALAFNYIVATYLFASGNILIIIAGIVVLILLQLLVFALGSLSAGIQAIRLNYVEFFLKFYNGGGVSFEPLGYKRKYSTETEV